MPCEDKFKYPRSVTFIPQEQTLPLPFTTAGPHCCGRVAHRTNSISGKL